MGTAYVAIVGPEGVKEMELRVPPRRITIKRRISNNALIELKKLITGDRPEYSYSVSPQP